MKLRMTSMESACIAASALLVAGLLAVAACLDIVEAVSAARLWERLAARFDDPACAAFIEVPVTALPHTAQMTGHPCQEVVGMRRFHERDGGPPLTAAELRTRSTWYFSNVKSVLRDSAYLAGAALIVFYALGLAATLLSRRLTVVGSAVRQVVARLPAGRRGRLAAWFLQVGVFFAVGVLVLSVLIALG